jgi:hypothetical protein
MDTLTPTPTPEAPLPATSPAPQPRGRRTALIGGAAVVVAVGIALAAILPGRLAPSHSSTGTARNGCPMTTAPANPPTSNETFNYTTDLGKTVQAKVGDIISVVLPANFVWEYKNTVSTSLSLASPLQNEGYYDSARQVCVWNFKAIGAGQNELIFPRRMLCDPGRICSGIEIDITVSVAVH